MAERSIRSVYAQVTGMRSYFFTGYDDKNNAIVAYIERHGENNGRIIIEYRNGKTKVFSEQRYGFNTDAAYDTLIANGYKDLYLM